MATRAVLIVALAVTGVAFGNTVAAPFGVADQQEGRPPLPWRALTPQEAEAFDLGHAVFNTQWSPAQQPAGRSDGLGPLFNAPSCDACHNSRRRGRGPAGAGQAPLDLVIQVGTVDAEGRLQRGTERFGFVLNTSANSGMKPEATVTIRYRETTRELPDRSRVKLRMPTYDMVTSDGVPLDAAIVLMPRMPQSVQGLGLLERVPEKEVIALSEASGGVPEAVRGQVPWVQDGRFKFLGRFGWQGTEPSVASQVAAAFSREMGLTTPFSPDIDCGRALADCARLPTGGTVEVEGALLMALLTFQELHAVARTLELQIPEEQSRVARASFEAAGCAACHRTQLPLKSGLGDPEARVIEPYTDLLLHDLGPELADRDVAGRVIPSLWRTAPLWGINASVATGRAIRLLHDGRARSIEEAIAWHGGAAADARARFEKLSAAERALLVRWISSL